MPDLKIPITALCFLVLVVTLFEVSAGEIYKCTANGKTVFTDKPCDGSPVELKPLNSFRAIEVQALEYSSTRWYYNASGYQEALKTSSRFNAPIFIYFQADWCGYCRKLEKQLLNKPDAKQLLSNVVKVQITPEDGSAERALFKQMGGKGYPSVFTKKNTKAPPVRRYLQTQQNGQWRTMTTDELGGVINAL